MMDLRTTIFKTYRKDIWSKFMKAITSYKLIEANDRIAVCISGGKDSMLLAYCFKLLQPISSIPFELEYLVMDPGYTAENRARILANAESLDIPIKIVNSDIFAVVDSMAGKPCYLCARMRRGHLYQFAKDLGCNKIALGHHYDDVIETTLMNIFYGGQFGTMLPKLCSENHEGLQLIRPFYLVREEAIIRWTKYVDMSFLNCACQFTEKLALSNDPHQSKRQEMKDFIKAAKKDNPFLEANIFRSVENVNLNKLISYHDDDNHTHFLDKFETEEL